MVYASYAATAPAPICTFVAKNSGYAVAVALDNDDDADKSLHVYVRTSTAIQMRNKHGEI